MKKKRIIITVLLTVTLIFLVIIFGLKISTDGKIMKEKEQQVKLVKLAKNKFKNMEEIKIVDFYESSPGVKNIDFDVTTNNGQKVQLNSISSLGGYINNGLELGKTVSLVQVTFENGTKEDL
ncbi:hypothetical protein OGZ37_13025 [Lactococcus lactis]|uniref:hypothetical protein n=1 Tax=Lactococcus lactis TaxID=1358 RepID=UPI002418180A|nr:hypothetical protein [Lactococcus lactis]MDG4967480.1 hypothetical protein [Lactococcus lactis]